jgi:hypothetical protein
VDRGQVKPVPTDDLEMGEVGLAHLVRRCGLFFELIGSLYHEVCGAGDEVMGLGQAIGGSL